MIEKAAAAVAPRFDQIVEDFAARLSDFVTAAGDALPSRHLRGARPARWSERRQQGTDVQAREGELDAQAARLRHIEARLAALRERLWESSTESTGSPSSSAT